MMLHARLKEPMKKIKVLPKGMALVTDYDALDSGVRRFVGRVFDPSVGGWMPVDNPVLVTDRQEYRQAIKDGDLTLCE